MILHQTSPIELENAVVTGDLDLRGQTIRQPVLLSRLMFKGQVFAAGATFEHGFTATDSIFEQPVDFSSVLSRSWVSFDYDIFQFGPAGQDTNVSLSLGRSQVEGGVSLRSDCFFGPVDASLMSITGGISIRDGWFLYAQASPRLPSLDLSYTIAAGNAVLKNNKVQPPVDFSNLIIGGSLDLHGTILANAPVTATPLSWHCLPQGADQCRASSFDGLRVSGPASLYGSVLQGCLSMSGASFGVLDPRVVLVAIASKPCTEQAIRRGIPGPRPKNPPNPGSQVPVMSHPLDIDGLRYTQLAGGHDAVVFMASLIDEYICVPSLPWKECDPSQARAQFTLLESVAASQGDREGADDVFIRGQWWDVVHKEANTPWGLLVTSPQVISGYYVDFGRRPLRAILTWIVFLFIGFLTFSAMRRLAEETNPVKRVNPLWYSAQSFLPPEWTGVYPAEFEKGRKWIVVAYVTLGFVLLGMFVYSISGASLPAVLPVCVSWAAVVHRLLLSRPQPGPAPTRPASGSV